MILDCLFLIVKGYKYLRHWLKLHCSCSCIGSRNDATGDTSSEEDPSATGGEERHGPEDEEASIKNSGPGGNYITFPPRETQPPPPNLGPSEPLATTSVSYETAKGSMAHACFKSERRFPISLDKIKGKRRNSVQKDTSKPTEAQFTVDEEREEQKRAKKKVHFKVPTTPTERTTLLQEPWEKRYDGKRKAELRNNGFI